MSAFLANPTRLLLAGTLVNTNNILRGLPVRFFHAARNDKVHMFRQRFVSYNGYRLRVLFWYSRSALQAVQRNFPGTAYRVKHLRHFPCSLACILAMRTGIPNLRFHPACLLNLKRRWRESGFFLRVTALHALTGFRAIEYYAGRTEM